MVLICCAVGRAQLINKNLPIKGDNGQVYLSAPYIVPTYECSLRVKIMSVVPGATINVYLTATQAGPVSPRKLIGGPIALAVNGMTVPLTQALKTFDQLEATQTFLGVTSALSAPMTAGPMPTSLPQPTIDGKNIYACGVIAPTYNLVSGVTVKVFDKTAGGATIGTDTTPDDWGSNWDPVLTSALDAPPKTSSAHDIYAQQSACNGAMSSPGPAVAVQPQPAVNQPDVVSAIVGNNTVTLDKLLTGAIVQIFDHATPLNGPSAATGDSNWFLLMKPLTAMTKVMPEQKLCQASTQKKEWPTTSTIPPPVLESPICPGQGAAFVRNSTVNAALVLLKGSTPEGYGGAATGVVPLDIAPPAVFATGDKIRVAEYFTNAGSPPPVYSNTVTVGCEVHVRQDIAKLTPAQINSLRQGFLVMMMRSHLNPNDPTGFTFQANIHSTLAGSNMWPMGDPSNPLWDQCQHYSDLFFPWHRMYLYYFERILRAASGDPNLALPYWNYESASEQALPTAFTTPTIDCAGDPASHPGCNPLYIPGRPMNGGALLATIGAPIGFSNPADDSAAMMDKTFEGSSMTPEFGGAPPPGTPPAACHFDSAQGDLEAQPHDVIHDVVGAPYMCCPSKSANDPVFYAHHTEIDHLWEVWLAQGGGRANPTSDTTWMNTSFRFYDETGNVVSLSVKDTLDTVTQLDYRYDDEPQAGAMARRAEAQAEALQQFPTTPPGQIAVSPQTGVGLSNETIQFQLALTAEAAAKINQLLQDKQFRHAIVLNVDVGQADEPTGVYYQVFVDLPADQTPTSHSIYYVGNLGLFLPKGAGVTKRFELIPAIRALMDKKALDASQLTITLVPRGLVSPDGKPLPLQPGVQATIKQVSLIAR
jgi:tyrosinase